MRTRNVFFAAMAALGLFAIGCDDGDPVTPQSCTDIINACHEVDPGTGEAHECHETAHDVGTAEACDPIAVNCVAVCEALTPVDGGAHEHDGGAHEHDGGP
ncbi:MAG: hypothetical protein AB7S26_25920 [Sandaracinaceae bacterium]